MLMILCQVHILDKNFLPVLLEHIDEENLPVFLGGKFDSPLDGGEAEDTPVLCRYVHDTDTQILR